MTLVCEIKECIEKKLANGQKNFTLFPFGDVGMQINNILKDAYHIDAQYILDNHLCAYNSNIKPLSFLKEVNCKNFVLILASLNPEIYNTLKEKVLEYISPENLAELESMQEHMNKKSIPIQPVETPIVYTKAGKYSYGPLCNHPLVESVGAFCSFANGCNVVSNHPTHYVSTHPFIYFDKKINPALPRTYDESQHAPWYFERISPKGIVNKLSKPKIGNDVWLGHNVIITNGANIGNGVIAGAGSVITKDIPNYAIVAGVPARIIRYRYTPEQIEALNQIQ